jgi:hypothetical protein
MNITLRHLLKIVSSEAYLNIIVKKEVKISGEKENIDVSDYENYLIEEIDPDLEKINTLLTIGVLNITIYKA